MASEERRPGEVRSGSPSGRATINNVELFTEGACSGNPGPGGWGAILRMGAHEKELSGGEAATTNNRMEMTAVIEGLKALKKPSSVTIHTDSRYVMDGAEKWLRSWKVKGWKTADKKPVKNEDLWRGLGGEMGRNQIQWGWGGGHTGHV